MTFVIPSLDPVQTMAPGALPVSLALAKAHMRIDHAEEDSLIEQYLRAATAHLDARRGVLGFCLIAQRWRQDFPRWGRLRLPFGPVRSDGLVSVDYVDAAGAVQPYAVPAGTVVYSEHGALWVELTPGLALASRPDAVRVTFEAGEVEVEEDTYNVPPQIVQAILHLTAFMYENRDMEPPQAGSPVAIGVDRLLDPIRKRRV
jgi:uncharacterized phiE125 gp8 family phage protein